jgi:cytochrome c biogenesis protein CcmG, thiol:disulfide interchange protein DsbE
VKHRSVIIAGVVGVALLGLIVLFATSPKDQDPSESSGSPVVGKLAPALAGATVDGQRFDLDKQRGKWVLVNFFATWCPPCVQEHPELVKFSRDTAGTAQVVSVAFDDTAQKVDQFFAANGGDWPVLAKDTEDASVDYGVIKLPESYLIDPGGKIVKKFSGGITAAEVERVIAAKGGAATASSGSGS